MVVGGEGNDAEDGADPIVPLGGFEKGVVAAVVLNNEDAHDEEAVENGQREGEQVAELQAVDH